MPPETVSAVDALRSLLQQLASEWLRPPIERLMRSASAPRPTIINDPLWGSIRLYSWEVALLDTHLLQRLRFLRQLGVAHWVYPAAGHSRLEHSLGVLRQMQALLDSLERNSGVAGEKLVDDVTVKLLRMAALLHDCGHVLMSHVPEPLVSDLPGVRELVGEVTHKYRARKEASPSEAFAVIFVTSPAFVEFLGTRAVGADFITDPRDAAESIASFIVAGSGKPGRGFLSLLINGAYDADKLDYMPRDSLMAGIPCAVDVERVIEKVQCLSVPPNKVKKAYVDWSPPGSDGFVRVLALSKSAKSALHELATTRTLLYNKIYYHHKVRALEAMVRRLLTTYQQDKHPTVADSLKLTDEEVLLMNYPDAVALRGRRLLKRAFSIVPPAKEVEDQSLSVETIPVPANAETKEARRGWRRVRADERNGDLVAKIRAEAARIATLLEIPAPPDELIAEVDFPNQAKLGLDQFAFVGDGLGDFNEADIETSGERPETSKRLATSAGHVLAADQSILPTFLAARLVLQRDYSQVYDEACYAATKLDPDEIDKAEQRLRAGAHLEEAGTFAPVPQARIITHREVALETFLKVAWPRIEQLGVIFGRYQSQDTSPVSPASVARYLRQYKTEDLARAALLLLEAINFKDRDFFGGSLSSLLKKALELGPISCVCPLGATGDSSALLGYLMNDVPADLFRPVRQLELALEDTSGDGAILLWDDFCGRGGHGLTALSQWLGEHLPPFGLNERLVEKLSLPRLRRVREVRLVLGFSLAMEEGLNRLREYGRDMRLRLDVLKPEEVVPERDDLLTGSAVFKDAAERDRLQAFLKAKGRELLEPNTTRPEAAWTPEILTGRLLGYGNGGHKLVFYYNVPSVTLTALWERGPNWTPLFPRRRKRATPPQG